ncbi:MAG: hypothetical protein J6Z12_07490 [Paludibacteraceae bacterium]|nr:hypothetical protein [Paludibacteraceae bacterium]
MGLSVGKNTLSSEQKQVKGGFVTFDGEKYYQIVNYDGMQPFFISLASESDLWMYLSSTGALTAGRQSPDFALFPYYTDDKITESYEWTGSKTILHVKKGGNTFLWEPFSDRNKGVYNVERRIAKSTVGNKIRFMEENKDLGLTFQYTWENADKFGWIRKAEITAQEEVEVELVDGLQNLLPAGTNRLTQNTYSTLVDAYKKTELVKEASLVLLRMESIMVDRAEPSESLRVNTVWTCGLPGAELLVSSRQLDAFRAGAPIQEETEAKGVRGAIFAHATLKLAKGQSQTWYFVAEVAQDAAQVFDLIDYLQHTSDIAAQLEAGVAAGTKTLLSIVGEVDGIQETADDHGMARHFANALFNTMRGGFYCDNYTIFGAAFAKHVGIFNTALAKEHEAFLRALPERISYSDLEAGVLKQNDQQLYRLFQEYLPLTFSRRHGDPSRPWNLFNIKVNDADGNKLISYQGNWRDIVQNWEALSLSYPAYINGIISKFLNATTVEGYNPYKVTSEGIDWEVIVPEDPWSNIGYWGDHQMIYLLKLLELSRKYYPQALQSYLNNQMYAYANVPYRFRTYREIVANPKDSIFFDDDLHKHIFEILPKYGADARLVLGKSGQPVLATFTEKLLVTLLAKMANLVPEGGIWMNTLRPEWNDANNALVGFGASMVTLYYMRRFMAFAKTLYGESEQQEFTVSEEMAGWFNAMKKGLEASKPVVEKGFDDVSRRVVIDALGQAAEAYRNQVYKGFSEKKSVVKRSDLLAFFDLALLYLDESMRANKRTDGMYHAYNLVSFSEGKVSVEHLYEMLEGQVAVLTSLQLSAGEAADLLDSLRASALYRADQNSYILYPNKRLASFLEKNNVPAADAASPLVKKLLAAGKSIFVQDKRGGVHFNGGFNNADFLAAALDKLPASVQVSAAERKQLLDLYERMFNHKAFTGRSGTFYKYEGLGCIYWHMVSKLLLAVGENIQKALAEGAAPRDIERLKAHYAAVKAGIGAHKQPDNYGSFPFDPYSHTPSMAGVQQPGMTGQVKEDIINRFFELGVSVQDGRITFKQDMLDAKEFVGGRELKFTYCAVPMIYRKDGQSGIEVRYADGKTQPFAGYELDGKTSGEVFARNKNIQSITIHLS